MFEPSCRKGPLFSFVYPVFPWFGMLCHVSPLRVSSGHSTLVLTLTDKATHASPPSPYSLGVDMSLWAASQLVIAIQHEICGDFFLSFFLFFFFFVMLPSEIPKFPHWHRLWEGFLLCGIFSFPTPSPGLVSTSKSFVSFHLYLLSYLISKRLICLSGYLGSSTSIQKLFCGSCFMYRWSFVYLWGRKWSPHPTPPPSWDCPPNVEF